MDEQDQRDRKRRSERQSRASRFSKERSEPSKRRIYVSNVPYEYDWKDVKDLFRKHVGDVSFVQMFLAEDDRPKGCGIVEFPSAELARTALEKMQGLSVRGRNLAIKEDSGRERDERGNALERRPVSRSPPSSRSLKSDGPKLYDTYGLSAKFLESIGVDGPLHSRVFVANLDYKVNKGKLKEVFKMAGKLRNVDLSVDKEGNSRGFAVIEYDHPVEAVQAISMFDQQFLYDRKLTVRMDRINSEKNGMRLPEGLKGIGIGLGPNGEPLRDVAQNIVQCSTGARPLQSNQYSTNPNSSNLTLNNFSLPNMNSANILGLQNFNLGSMGSIQNRIQPTNFGLASFDTAIKVGPSSIETGRNSLNAFNNRFPNGTNNFMGTQSISNLDKRPRENPFTNSRRSSNMENWNEKPMDMIRVSNIPSSVNWQLFREKFGDAGEIKFAEKIDAETSIIQYYDNLAATRAIELFDLTYIDRQLIRVQYY